MPDIGEAQEYDTGALPKESVTQSPRCDPSTSLDGCERIVVVGRTGSGKTTLARELAAVLDVRHVELDALYFGPNFSTVSPSVLKDRTREAVVGDRWVTDGNKSAVRDLVWPRADTIIWLDYPLVVSLWRLGGRARGRALTLQATAAETGERRGLPKQLLLGAKGVLGALRSHAGQRRAYPKMFAAPQNQHLEVHRLRSPKSTRLWLERVTGD